PDLRAEVQVGLSDTINGTRRRLELIAQDECTTCAGSGLVTSEQRQGKTRVIQSAKPCPTCGGAGVIPTPRTLEVTIAAGATDGTHLRLKGQGGRAPQSEMNGDLF